MPPAPKVQVRNDDGQGRSSQHEVRPYSQPPKDVAAWDVLCQRGGVREIWVERRKWPQAPHYGHAGWVLGEDEHGLWLELRVGSPVYRGEEVLFHGTSGGLMVVPPDDGWLAWFPAFGDVELYVDVVSGTTRTESSVTMVDLDLDVIRRRDGSVELLDEEEFALHRVELEYPAQLIQHAERMADHVLGAVRANVEPFAGAAALGWMTRRTDSPTVG
jgi:uncharacterized protein